MRHMHLATRLRIVGTNYLTLYISRIYFINRGGRCQYTALDRAACIHINRTYIVKIKYNVASFVAPDAAHIWYRPVVRSRHIDVNNQGLRSCRLIIKSNGIVSGERRTRDIPYVFGVRYHRQFGRSAAKIVGRHDVVGTGCETCRGGAHGVHNSREIHQTRTDDLTLGLVRAIDLYSDRAVLYGHILPRHRYRAAVEVADFEPMIAAVRVEVEVARGVINRTTDY